MNGGSSSPWPFLRLRQAHCIVQSTIVLLKLLSRWLNARLKHAHCIVQSTVGLLRISIYFVKYMINTITLADGRIDYLFEWTCKRRQVLIPKCCIKIKEVLLIFIFVFVLYQNKILKWPWPDLLGAWRIRYKVFLLTTHQFSIITTNLPNLISFKTRKNFNPQKNRRLDVFLKVLIICYIHRKN